MSVYILIFKYKFVCTELVALVMGNKLKPTHGTLILLLYMFCYTKMLETQKTNCKEQMILF